MFRFKSRKPERERNDNGLTGMLLHNLGEAERLVDIDWERGHDYFIRAVEIYGGLRRDIGTGMPEIEFRLDELYIEYQMKIDAQNALASPQSL